MDNESAPIPVTICLPPADEEVLWNQKAELEAEIVAQVELVRKVKGDPKSSEADKKEAIEKLLALKLSFKEKTGQEYQAPGGGRRDNKKGGENKKKEEKPKQPKLDEAKGDGKKSKLGIEAKKDVDYSKWYSQVIEKSEMIEWDASLGGYVVRPWSYAIWEGIQQWFDAGIKKLGVKNCYFPMFVSNSALEREKTHIADLAPEVACVTRAGNSEMAEPIAIRPTSETVMYPSYKKWVQSHRDLPIKLNQWCNVVRWEQEPRTPFLGTGACFSQEGHAAYANAKDAEADVFKILDLYASVYTDLLAIPLFKGLKSKKPANGEFTLAVQAYVPILGTLMVGATSNHLGQNFSKMFDISFEDPTGNGEKMFAYQNSWRINSEALGLMVLIHADDNGLVLPPRVACIQAIALPVGITAQTSEEQRNKITRATESIVAQLVEGGVRAEADLRDNYSPGWKFNHWELKGVPIRVEIGPKDLAANKVTAVIRFNGEKKAIKRDNIVESLKNLLEEIHTAMYEKALAVRNAHMKVTTDFEEFKNLLDEKFVLLSPFCGEPKCEEAIKLHSLSKSPTVRVVMGAAPLCTTDELADIDASAHCIHPECPKKPKRFVLFGRNL